MTKLKLLQMLFAGIFAWLIAGSGIAANQAKVGELLPRLNNLQSLIERLRERVKYIKKVDPEQGSVGMDLKNLNIVDNALVNMKTELKLYEPDVISDPEKLVTADNEKYSNLVGIVITINAKTCPQIVPKLKPGSSKFQIKLHFAMENNCAKVRELLSRRTLGEDINKLQINLNDELMSNLKLF